MSSADFSSLYSSGDLILENPIQSSSVFLMIVVVCASIEYLFSLADQVDSKFFKEMFDTISEEVLVVGVLSLLLTFGSSLVSSLPPQWSVMFDWAHICLLFMGLMFVLLLCLVIAFVFSGSTRWHKFEMDRIKTSIENHSSREQRYRMACDKFKVALRAYGYSTEVSFTHYVNKAEKECLVALGNLSWKSWMALSTIVVLNAMRTKVIPQDSYGNLDDTGNLTNILSFLLIAGYGTLGMFIGIHLRLQLRFRQYLMLTSSQGQAAAAAASPLGVLQQDAEPTQQQQMEAGWIPTKADLDDPQSFLLWQSAENSIAMVQAVLMFLVWYAAVFCLNMFYPAFNNISNIGLTLVILCAAVAPLIAFIIVVPWTITTIAMLSCLGTSLREEWVKSLIARKAAENQVNGGDSPSNGGGGGSPNSKGDDSHTATGAAAKRKVEIKQPRAVVFDDASMQRLLHSQRSGAQQGFEL